MNIFKILIILFLSACDADKLNRFAANINKSTQEKFENLTSSKPDLSSAKPKLSTIEDANNTLKEINQSYKETKEQAKAAKQSISEGVAETKQSARRFARKMPRSQVEMNKMIVAFGEKYFGGWRTSFKRVNRQTSSQSKKSNKMDASRLR